MNSQQLPDSKHFRLQQIANGVYAAIHIDGGTAIGNAGIIDLGDRTLIFDTFGTPQAAQDLRNAAETLTGRPIDVVINSHWHHDHIWGNQVFDVHTDITSSEETRRLFVSANDGKVYDASYFARAKAELEATLIQFQSTPDEAQRRQLGLMIDYCRSIVQTKTLLKARAPNVTYSKQLTYHGAARSAELITFNGCHSECDAVLFLPQDKIAFMGDLLCVDYHPWLVDGDPEKFCRALDAVSELAPELLVPGHGPVGHANSLSGMKEYIRTLDETAQKLVEDGEAEEIIDTLAIPEPYDDWLFASFYTDNMHAMYRRWSGEQGDVEGSY